MKVLLVEDDVFFQHFYTEKLREQQYEVEVAGNGEDGLKKARSFLPDIILLDIIMPQKDGFTVLQEKQVDSVLQHIPVLVFSTLGSESDIQKALQLGAAGYINKSFFDFEVLNTKIQQIVQTGTK